LASSIILVCRKRQNHALTISRREFIRELNRVLPEALDEMTKGAGGDHSPVAPVDLSQAIIGPGMAVFSKYAAVLEADGSPMSVRTALQLINRFLAEDDFDPTLSSASTGSSNTAGPKASLAKLTCWHAPNPPV
jgi:putative DNA methylase